MRVVRIIKMVVIVIFITSCSTKPVGEQLEITCDPLIVPLVETRGLVINGINGNVDAYMHTENNRNYGLINLWKNEKDGKDILAFIDEENFVWLRVDGNGSGYTYAGIYSINENNLHMVVYANNEMIEEYNFNYWFTTYTINKYGIKFEFNILHLDEENGSIIDYKEVEVYYEPMEEDY